MEFILAALDRTGKVGVLDSVYIALIGVAIVFVVLAFLMGVLYLVGVINKSSEKLAVNPKYVAFTEKVKNAFKPKKKKKEEEIQSEKKEDLAKGSCGDLVLVNTSDRDAAMIMAIVADTLETPLNELHFKSIKQVGEESKS